MPNARNVDGPFWRFRRNLLDFGKLEQHDQFDPAHGGIDGVRANVLEVLEICVEDRFFGVDLCRRVSTLTFIYICVCM
jgi:hypothetical protein